MKINLTEIERVETISKEDFYANYVKKQKPLVIEKLTEDWPAYKKWKLDYIKSIAAEKIVPLYDDRPVSHKDGFNQAHAEMKMADYIDLLQSKPTNYRIFLYDLMKEMPVLHKDFQWPDLGLRLIKQLPMLFLAAKAPEYSCILILITPTYSIFNLTVKSNVFYLILIRLLIYIKFHIH